MQNSKRKKQSNNTKFKTHCAASILNFDFLIYVFTFAF